MVFDCFEEEFFDFCGIAAVRDTDENAGADIAIGECPVDDALFEEEAVGDDDFDS